MRYFLFMLFSLPALLIAQEIEEEKKRPIKEYTYYNDRVFLRLEDFQGYVFVPSKGKLTVANFEDPINLGSVILDVEMGSVAITEKTIFTTSGIKGDNDSKPYKMAVAKISQTTDKSTNYFEMVLTDFLNPNIQGYLRFYTDKGYCYKILFKPEGVASERTFFMTVPPYHIEVRDSKFFTHESDLPVKEIDSLMGELVYPFSEFKDVQGYREFSRLYPDDGVSFKFEIKYVKKGRREKPFKYLIFSDGRNADSKPKEYLIKKAKESKYKDFAIKQERECLILTLFDAEIKKDTKLYLFRNSNTKKLNGIRMGEFEYAMRPGKKITK